MARFRLNATDHLRKRRSPDAELRREANRSEVMSVTVLLGLLGSYSFFTGWLYAYYLFRRLGVSLNALGLPLQHYYIYSYTVFSTWWGLAVLAAALAVGYAITLVGGGKWLVAPALVAFFPVCVYLARDVAEDTAHHVRAGTGADAPKAVYLTFRATAGQIPLALSAASARGALRLIARSKEEYYVLWQPRPDEADPEWPAGRVYRIRADDVLAAAVALPGFPKE